MASMENVSQMKGWGGLYCIPNTPFTYLSPWLVGEGSLNIGVAQPVDIFSKEQ